MVAWKLSAILIVSSADPVSTTTISSTTFSTLCRQRARQRASFLTIMASESFGLDTGMGGIRLPKDAAGIARLSAINDERLDDGLDSVMIQHLLDIGSVQLPAFRHQ